MYPNSRSLAKRLNANKYDTGKPCTHGHLSYRYTDSGSCAACINPPKEARAVAATPAAMARLKAISQLMEIKVRAFPGDIAEVAQAAYTMCCFAEPSLELSDVRSGRAPTDGAGGTALYKLNVLPQFVEAVRDTANRHLGKRPVDVGAVRAQAFGKVAAFIAEDSCPPPAWKP